MRKTVPFAALFGVIAAVSAIDGVAQDARVFCSLDTLKGTYLFSNQGFEGEQPLAATGMYSFDGAGNVVTHITRSIEPTEASGPGSYTIGHDCAGTMTLSEGVNFRFYADPEGVILYQIRMDQGTSVNGVAKRITRRAIF